MFFSTSPHFPPANMSSKMMRISIIWSWLSNQLETLFSDFAMSFFNIFWVPVISDDSHELVGLVLQVRLVFHFRWLRPRPRSSTSLQILGCPIFINPITWAMTALWQFFSSVAMSLSVSNLMKNGVQWISWMPNKSFTWCLGLASAWYNLLDLAPLYWSWLGSTIHQRSSFCVELRRFGKTFCRALRKFWSSHLQHGCHSKT